MLLLLCIIVLCIIIATNYWNSFKYWQKRKIPVIKPYFPFGNFGPLFLLQSSIGELLKKLYESTDEPFIGIYTGTQPILLIRDPKLIHIICVTDSQKFPGRGIYIDEKYDLLSANILTLSGSRWKMLRQKLAPIFTIAKLKAMLPIILEFCDPLEKYINRKIDLHNGIIEVKELFSCYTTDVTGSIIFGIQCNSIENSNDEFRVIGRQIFDLSIMNGLRLTIFMIWPEIQKILKFKTFGGKFEKFMIDLVEKNLEYREKNNIRHNDIFQLLMDLRNDEINGKSENPFSIIEIASQLTIFYIAGFESASTTISYLSFELAKHPETQCKIQEEIDSVLKLHNNQITYEALNDMIYLESCVNEILRLYPALPVIRRKCEIPCKIPETNFIIESGTQILIPIFGIQRDSKYYKDPNEFVPERFDSKKRKLKNFLEMPFLPFGNGPRGCIAKRMGVIQAMITACFLLKKYSIQLDNRMDTKLQFSARHFALAPKNGIFLKFSKRMK